ncbi:MAG TPA: MarR family transcriptional regulator [Burkholderiales bacterium]|nr:MarR family transcriptional regulator [Burkholderiales bacterium]
MAKKDTEPLDLRLAPGHLLRRCHQRSHEIFNQAIGKRGITRQQTAVLLVLAEHPGASQQELSDASGFDRNTLAEISNRLIRKGLIERRRSDSDSRAYEVFLTAAGSRLVKRILPDAHEVQRRILEPLPAELRDVFVRCLRIMLGLEKP